MLSCGSLEKGIAKEFGWEYILRGKVQVQALCHQTFILPRCPWANPFQFYLAVAYLSQTFDLPDEEQQGKKGSLQYNHITANSSQMPVQASKY